MTMKKMNLGTKSLLAFLGLAGMSMLSMKAAPVVLTAAGNNLYNTGVEIDDLTLIPSDPTGNNNPADPTYSVAYYADGAEGHPPTLLPPSTLTPGFYGTPTLTGTAYVAAPLPGNGSEAWVSNASNAQWITYTPNINTNYGTPDTAVTVYELDLTNIPVGAEITIGGEVASDDDVTIYGNGTKLFSDFNVADDGGSIKEDNYNQYNPLSGLTFVSENTNTLDFVVYNGGAFTTGLNAQLNGSYTVVPEPTTAGLMVLGCIALFIFGRAKIRQGEKLTAPLAV
jgi:hypothetical protein